jgi:hypothetical protein
MKNKEPKQIKKPKFTRQNNVVKMRKEKYILIETQSEWTLIVLKKKKKPKKHNVQKVNSQI